MTKKLLILISILLFCLPVLAEGVDWSVYDNLDKSWDGQKPVTNKEFEDTMEALQAKQKKKEAKKQQKILRRFKGDSLHDDTSVKKTDIKPQNPEDEPDGQLINIPVDLFVNNKKIERGFYQAVGIQDGNEVFINLYQAHSLKGQIKVRETEDDFNETELNFIKLLPYDNSRMKIIYGSLGFNAHALVRFDEPKFEN